MLLFVNVDGCIAKRNEAQQNIRTGRFIHPLIHLGIVYFFIVLCVSNMACPLFLWACANELLAVLPDTKTHIGSRG